MQKKNDHTLLPIYDTLENINKTPSEHSNIHHVHFIHTKLPSLQKVNKVEKKMRYQTGTHELEKWLPLGTMRPAAGSEVLFVNQSSIPVSRHWATQPGVSLGRTASCSSTFKRYDSKDCLPNKPHCPQQVMIARKIDKVKWSPNQKFIIYFVEMKPLCLQRNCYTSTKKIMIIRSLDISN